MRKAFQTLYDNGYVDFEDLAQELIAADNLDEDNKKYVALVSQFGKDAIDFEPSHYDDCLFESGATGYLVLTEDERDTRIDCYLESYLDDCVEGSDSVYFDRKEWKADARANGADLWIASYDGHEYEAVISGEYFYIYRVA